ncbi:hypothetical protein CHUAL_009576 [Chamberlinius hualienensis]
MPKTICSLFDALSLARQAATEAKARQKAQYDALCRPSPRFAIGDFVFVDTHLLLDADYGLTKKFYSPWDGPHKVTAVSDATIMVEHPSSLGPSVQFPAQQCTPLVPRLPSGTGVDVNNGEAILLSPSVGASPSLGSPLAPDVLLPLGRPSKVAYPPSRTIMHSLAQKELTSAAPAPLPLCRMEPLVSSHTTSHWHISGLVSPCALYCLCCGFRVFGVSFIVLCVAEFSFPVPGIIATGFQSEMNSAMLDVLLSFVASSSATLRSVDDTMWLFLTMNQCLASQWGSNPNRKPCAWHHMGGILTVHGPQDPPHPLSEPRALPRVHQCCVHPSLPMPGQHIAPWVSTLPVPFPSLPPVTISQPNSAAPDGALMGEPLHTVLGASSALPVEECEAHCGTQAFCCRYPLSSTCLSSSTFGASMEMSPLPSGAAPPSPMAGPSTQSTPRCPSCPLPRFSPIYVTPSFINCLESDGAKFRRLVRLGTLDDPQHAENLSLPFASGLIPRGTLWAELGHYKKRLQSRHLASKAKDKRYAKVEREALNLVMGPREVRFLQERLARKK